MLVKYLMDQLKQYDPDDELIVDYWDRGHVAMNLEREINDDAWHDICVAANRAMDYLDWWGDIRWVAIETLDKGDK